MTDLEHIEPSATAVGGPGDLGGAEDEGGDLEDDENAPQRFVHLDA